MRRATAALALAVSALLVACGGAAGTKSTPSEPAPFATALTQTPDSLLNEAIDFAVRLGVMTREQATCVFHDHPSVLQEFAQETGLGTTAAILDTALKQKAEDLIRRNAVQLDRCFTGSGG